MDSGTGPSDDEEAAPITIVYEADDLEAGAVSVIGDAVQADDVLAGAGENSGLPAGAEKLSDEWGRPVDADGNLLTEDGQLWLDETGSPVYAYDAPPPDADATEGRTQQ